MKFKGGGAEKGTAGGGSPETLGKAGLPDPPSLGGEDTEQRAPN